MSSLPSIIEDHQQKRVYTPIRGKNDGNGHGNCPDSIMKIMQNNQNKENTSNEDMSSPTANYKEWENELFGDGKFN